MLEQGEVDIAEKVPIEAVEALGQDPNIDIYRTSGVRVLYLRFNGAAGPTADVRVRQALSYAFDYDGYREATGGFFQPSDGPVPADFMGGWKPEIPYTYDLDKAKALFEEAGIPEGTVFDCYWTAGTPEQRLGGQFLQAGLSQIGLDLNLIEMEWAPMSKSMVEWGATKDPATAMQMFFLWTPPRIPDAYAYLWYMYHTDASGGRGRNLMYYSNPKVDELIDAGALASDETAKMDAYKEAVNIIVDEAADVFIGPKDRVYTVRADVGGFYIHPTWYPAWHLYDYYRK
jgi:ABC-type transport system substrate-binding protein